MMWIIAILLICACGICAFYALNVLYKRTNHYKKDHTHILHLLEMGKGERFDVVNVGSSQILFGLDYSQCDVQADNWAAYPQYFEYDYGILQQFSGHINKGAIVLIPICAMEFFFGGGKVEIAAEDYYPVINKRYLPFCNVKRYLNARYPLIRRPQRVKYILRDTKWTWNGYPIEQNPCVSAHEYQEDADGFIARWNMGFGTNIPDLSLTDEQSSVISKNIHVLGNIARFCRGKGWHPVFLMLPATKYLTDKFTKDFIDKRVVANIKAADTETPLLNYWGDKRYMSTDLYLNSFFMNEKGRKLMGKQVVEDSTKIIRKND